MENKDIYSAIGAIDDDLLIRCEPTKKKPLNVWVKYGSIAACSCLVALGVFALLRPAANVFATVRVWAFSFTWV